jgi:hypothetical protein
MNPGQALSLRCNSGGKTSQHLPDQHSLLSKNPDSQNRYVHRYLLSIVSKTALKVPLRVTFARNMSAFFAHSTHCGKKYAFNYLYTGFGLRASLNHQKAPHLIPHVPNRSPTAIYRYIWNCEDPGCNCAVESRTTGLVKRMDVRCFVLRYNCFHFYLQVFIFTAR